MDTSCQYFTFAVKIREASLGLLISIDRATSGLADLWLTMSPPIRGYISHHMVWLRVIKYVIICHLRSRSGQTNLVLNLLKPYLQWLEGKSIFPPKAIHSVSSLLGEHTAIIFISACYSIFCHFAMSCIALELDVVRRGDMFPEWNQLIFDVKGRCSMEYHREQGNTLALTKSLWPCSRSEKLVIEVVQALRKAIESVRDVRHIIWIRPEADHAGIMFPWDPTVIAIKASRMLHPLDLISVIHELGHVVLLKIGHDDDEHENHHCDTWETCVKLLAVHLAVSVVTDIIQNMELFHVTLIPSPKPSK